MSSIYPTYGKGKIYRLFGVTRQAVSQNKSRQVQNQLCNEVVLKLVKAIRKVHPRIGVRKIYDLIEDDLYRNGIKMGRDKLFSLMADNQLLIRKRKRRTVTTNSYHHYKKYPNLIKEFIPYKPNQLWVSDITYIKYEDKFEYLFLITDAYSHKIVGYKLGQSLETEHAIRALKMALRNEKQCRGLIHHSDRGIQYCSNEYVKLLQDYEIKISMTQDGNPRDNAIAERVNGILKSEYIDHFINEMEYEPSRAVSQAIYRYNQLRPHLSCDMMTPNKTHKQDGTIKKRWKNYYKLKTEIIH